MHLGLHQKHTRTHQKHVCRNTSGTNLECETVLKLDLLKFLPWGWTEISRFPLWLMYSDSRCSTSDWPQLLQKIIFCPSSLILRSNRLVPTAHKYAVSRQVGLGILQKQLCRERTLPALLLVANGKLPIGSFPIM